MKMVNIGHNGYRMCNSCPNHKGLLGHLAALQGVKHGSVDLESSTQLNSGAIIRHDMPHHVHVDGINGTPAADM